MAGSRTGSTWLVLPAEKPAGLSSCWRQGEQNVARAGDGAGRHQLPPAAWPAGLRDFIEYKCWFYDKAKELGSSEAVQALPPE